MSGVGRARDRGYFEIDDLTDDRLPDVLAVLQGAFDRGFDRSWFVWKHRSGPWGPSKGWVASDADGVIGVRLFLPWEFHDGHEGYHAYRPCDTVTVPRARGRGVFRELTEYAISRLGDNTDFLFNTPNEQSKPGYMKMGFVDWTRVGQRIGSVTPNRAGLTEEVKLPSPESVLTTMRTEEYLDWRYRRCPINEYHVLALSDSDGPNGIVVRTRVWRGMRMVVVEECWGGQSQEKALVSAAAKLCGARLVWMVEALGHTAWTSVSRGFTAVTRFDLRRTGLPEPSLSLGDVESVL